LNKTELNIGTELNRRPLDILPLYNGTNYTTGKIILHEKNETIQRAAILFKILLKHELAKTL